MALSIAQKQTYIYLGLILVTILTSIFTYRLTQQKWLLFRDGEKQYHEKKFQDAIFLYQKSLEHGFTTTKLYAHLADSYTTTGNFPQAIKYYRQYLDHHPNDASIRLLLARTLSWNGNLEESKQEYQKLLEKTHGD